MAERLVKTDELVPGVVTMYSPNGTETQRVVDTIASVDWKQLLAEVSGKEVTHAVIGADISTEYGIELTGLLRAIGRSRKVILIPVDGKLDKLKDRLAGDSVSAYEGRAYDYVVPQDLYADPNKVLSLTRNLLNAPMPKITLETEG